MRVYIAGPYTNGDVGVNVHNAIRAADEVLELGHTPFVPHLTHFWHLLFPHPYETWTRIDNAWIPHCDVVLRLLGESKGADDEVELARTYDIPIIHSPRELAHIAPRLKPGKGGG